MTPKKGEWFPKTRPVPLDIEGIWEFRLTRWDLKVTWGTQQFVLRVEPELVTCSEVIEQILLDLKKQDEDRIFEYSLVMRVHDMLGDTESFVWLEPMHYISSLPPQVRELEVRTRPIPLNIRSKDGTTHAVLVNDTTTLQQVIFEFGNKLGLQGRHLQDYGLFNATSKEWLESGDVSSLLQRTNNIDLHFLLRPHPVTVVFQIQEFDIARLGAVRTAALNHTPTSDPAIPLYESPTTCPPPVSATLAPNVEIDVEPHSFKSQDVLVQFTLCVSEVLNSICRELHLEVDEYALFKETDGSVVELTQWKSLRNQGVVPESRLFLLKTQEGVDLVKFVQFV